ncbi:MAG: PDZ domain-containing protein [Leptotrichia sp.]|uniref:S1C family serine protease n=1 Tax=Leptotrichia sp. oral taxon 498 TaxID=712368 RepID=UPI000B8CA043|nr:trypsin-like peptidase domain-containing protein [Leptotrichia sp. oral taxon 498]ASQ48887.1 2-alkenal reductase [Leptotrichia sp. oral taxon 498]RKW35612.1 MAG: PDZ domain-containing protein [Leptotrichia sp.]
MKFKNILTSSFLAAALASGTTMAETSVLQNKQVVQNTNVSSDMYRAQDAFAAVYDKAKDSVVNIRTKSTIVVETYNPLEAFLFGTSGRRREKKETGSLGSGFIISSDGYIMTNNHVINGADEIYVKMSDGQEYLAKLVGTSPEVDIAILKVMANRTFKPLKFANSDNIKIGHWAIAFGNPLGLNSSMTVGVIGASGRSSLGIEQVENFIQTDAAINQGNSGGPLLNINGDVIGVNTAIYSTNGGSVGLSFAIPSNLASNVRDSILKSGRYERPYIGISVLDLTQEIKKQRNIPYSTGIMVQQVYSGSPAAKYGLKVGDIILEINGKTVTSAGAFIGELAAKKVGETVNLKVFSGGKEKNISMKLESFSYSNQQTNTRRR